MNEEILNSVETKKKRLKDSQGTTPKKISGVGKNMKSLNNVLGLLLSHRQKPAKMYKSNSFHGARFILSWVMFTEEIVYRQVVYSS